MSKATLLIVLCVLFAPVPTGAYETDQYSQRLVPLTDSLPLLDTIVNEALEKVANTWSGPPNDLLLAKRIYFELGGHFWIDRLERLTIESENFHKLPMSPDTHIYAKANLLQSRVTWVFGIGPSIQVNGTLIGVDKIGHFFSQGFKYYRRYLFADRRVTPEIMLQGALVEGNYFGMFTTGVFSNADLVANYEGMRFYRNLTEPLGNTQSLFRWDGSRPVVQRRFSWQEYLNDYWDEALNTSTFAKNLRPLVRLELLKLCGNYRNHPYRMQIPNATQLHQRYQHIGLRKNQSLSLAVLCAQEPASP